MAIGPRKASYHEDHAPGIAVARRCMKIRQYQFTIPKCIFDEPMPAKQFVLLCFLFSKSDFGGMARPGYAAMKRAIRGKEGEVGCDSTIRRMLVSLQKLGWIWHIKRSNGIAAIYLRIPPRLVKKQKSEDDSLLGIVSL